MSKNRIKLSSLILESNEILDRRKKEVALQNKITDTDWSDIYAPIITLAGKQHELVYRDIEATHDPGEDNHIGYYTCPKLPGVTFLAALQRIDGKYVPYQDGDWEVSLQ